MARTGYAVGITGSGQDCGIPATGRSPMSSFGLLEGCVARGLAKAAIRGKLHEQGSATVVHIVYEPDRDGETLVLVRFDVEPSDAQKALLGF